MDSDNVLLGRAQSAEAKYNTLKENVEPLKIRVQQFKENFGVREKADGAIDIDFEKMVDRLGPVACLELRAVIDEKHSISGVAGEKPKIRVVAAVQ